MRRITALIGAIVLAMHAHGSVARPALDVRVRLQNLGETLSVTIRNGPQESVAVPRSLVTWRPGVAGVEFRVWSSDGSEVSECVMIDYALGTQERVELKPSGVITQAFGIGDAIRRNFCLGRGTYFVQAIFHDEIDGSEFLGTVASNPVMVEMER